jgi:hypothetical protein
MILLDCHEPRALFITVKLVAAEMAMVIGNRDDNNLLQQQQNGDGASLHTYLLMLNLESCCPGKNYKQCQKNAVVCCSNLIT